MFVFLFQAICEIVYENNGYVAYEVQRYNAGTLAIMNSSIGSLGNGKRMFLAAGKDADCHIYQIKLRPRDKETGMMCWNYNKYIIDWVALNKWLRHFTKSDAKSAKDNPGLRQRNIANGKPANMKDDANSDPADAFAGDLVFDIQAITNVQTDFRYN